MNITTLNKTLELIAERHNLNADELKAYAEADDIGGYHPDPAQAKFYIGSIFAVEGKILYALTRALKPSLVLNLGVFRGCSTQHIGQALLDNGSGKMIAVDLMPYEVDEKYQSVVDFVQGDAVEWLTKYKSRSKFGLVFEDMLHSEEQVKATYEALAGKVLSGGLILSHDACHYLVGEDVRAGIEGAGYKPDYYLTAPSDCGLSVCQV